MRNLYKVYNGYGVFMVIAEHETQASEHVVAEFVKKKYFDSYKFRTTRIDLVALEQKPGDIRIANNTFCSSDDKGIDLMFASEVKNV